ncbi:unnamed protein product [Leptidea sinapis]|uniref:Uncharacterized protein n=1 Tax=Leptidea sinapis TaxID=189913 RepID=A0A5E4PYA8_9NEOP|nr:unnamed protein product [Leptidea sinapis]
MLLKCIWAAEIVDCSSVFSVRRTIRGHCCVFNYVLDYESAGRKNKRTDVTSNKTNYRIGN